MVLDSSDLQHRRTATSKSTSSRSTKIRTISGNNGISSKSSSTTTTRRRRVRKGGSSSETNGAAFIIATILFASIAIPLVLFARNRLFGIGGDGTSNSNTKTTENRSLLRDWKPKTKRRTSAANSNFQVSMDDLEAEQRAKERETRYRSLYRPKFDESTLGYDIHDCPSTPPDGYPKAWKTTEVLRNWNPTDVTTLPPSHRNIYQGLCVFDYQTQYETALTYRNAEKPFVIRNDPKVTSVARRWEDDPEYLHRALGDVEEFRTERSPSELFMWYRLRGGGKHAAPEGYERPENDEVEMTYGEWLEHALEKDGRALGDEDAMAKVRELRERRLDMMREREEDGDDDDEGGDDALGGNDDKERQGGGGRRRPDKESEEAKREKYFYFRINADLKSAQKEGTASNFIYDELTFLDPRNRRDSKFYIVDPNQERGINCRFGMRGVTAANHFDMSRNTIALFGGERRYVLASPSQCDRMALYKQGHPSVRHSSLDWSDPVEWEEHLEFKGALVNEVVLHAGDVLYLPTNWFHYIVNLSLNYQCNARSGITHETAHFVRDCGFSFKGD